MDVGELCTREVFIATTDESVRAAARRMRDRQVGTLVVVEETAAGRVPVGILTDRDIVIYAVAAGGQIPDRPIGACMSQQIVTAQEHEDLGDVLRRMRVHGVRRVPIVDHQGVLQGLLALDDILELIAEEITDLAALLARQRRQPAQPQP